MASATSGSAAAARRPSPSSRPRREGQPAPASSSSTAAPSVDHERTGGVAEVRDEQWASDVQAVPDRADADRDVDVTTQCASAGPVTANAARTRRGASRTIGLIATEAAARGAGAGAGRAGEATASATRPYSRQTTA